MSFFKTYAWDIKTLSEDLRTGEVSQSYRMKAFLAFLVITYISSDLAAFVPEAQLTPPKALAAAELMARVVILIGGTLLCFRANERADGRDFVDRFMCLSLPVVLRVVVISIPLTFVASFLKARYFMTPGPESYSSVDSLLNLVLDFLWFVGLYRAFSKLRHLPAR